MIQSSQSQQLSNHQITIKSIEPLSAIPVIVAHHFSPPAANFHHCRASLMSFVTPLPIEYKQPKLYCVPAV